jgi:hypothetical protein
MSESTQDEVISKTELSPETFKPLLAKLISYPQSFSRSDAILAMEHLLDPTSTMPSQIGSFLTALHMSGMESHSEILAGGAAVLRRHAVPVPFETRTGRSRVVDIVGTGGDGHNTFNVSTTAAVVAAGAGAQVLKVHLSLIGTKYFINDTSVVFIDLARQQSIDLVLRFSGSSYGTRLPIITPKINTKRSFYPLPKLPLPPRPPLSSFTRSTRLYPAFPPTQISPKSSRTTRESRSP